MVCKHKVTSFCAPPTVYRFLIKEDLTRFTIFPICAMPLRPESPLNAEVFNQFKKITGLEIKEAFGQSETVSLGCHIPLGKARARFFGKGSRLLYGITLLNENGEPCDVGEEGEICITTKNGAPVGLFKEYYRDE